MDDDGVEHNNADNILDNKKVTTLLNTISMPNFVGLVELAYISGNKSLYYILQDSNILDIAFSSEVEAIQYIFSDND